MWGLSGMLKHSVDVGPAGLGLSQSWLRRRWVWLVAGCTALACLSLTWALWPASGRSQRYTPDPRSRRFSSFTVCVLTGSDGLAGVQAAQVWAGVEDGSHATSAQASYLPVPAPDGESTAEVYVNTLVSRSCSLVVATGASQVAAVRSRAAAYAAQRFVVVGSGSSAGNITVVRAGTADAVRSGVSDAVARAVEGDTSR